MGTQAQPISQWARDLITNRLTDWGTGQFIENEGFVLQCPTQSAEGSVEAAVGFDWNVPHGSLTGTALVVYVFDGSRQWRIVSGADPETGAIRSVRPLEGLNSIVGFNPLEFTVETGNGLPKLDLDTPDPSTRIIDSVAVFLPLGPGAPFTDRAPLDPTEFAGFTPPDLDHPSCPCPEPSNPTCQ
jgi:hypothetical protein